MVQAATLRSADLRLSTDRSISIAPRLALAEALDCGITTIHNWDHNLRTPQDADANILAQTDMGVRARFSYGCPDNFAGDQPWISTI
jgi:hypothetical protein